MEFRPQQGEDYIADLVKFTNDFSGRYANQTMLLRSRHFSPNRKILKSRYELVNGNGCA